MAKSTKTKNDGPLMRFDFFDSDHTPHWQNYGSGHASLTVQSHTENPYLSFIADEYSDKKGSSKKTMVTLDAEQARALYEWMKKLYSK